MESQSPVQELEGLGYVAIRPMIESDLPALEWEGEFTHFRRIYQSTFLRIQEGTSLGWVAETDKSGLLGQVFIHLVSDNSDLANGYDRAYFFSFRIKPQFQNKGLGTKMMEVFEDDLIKRNFQTITLNVAKDNARAIRLYQRRGYLILGNEPGEWSFQDHLGNWQHIIEPAWRMEKRLNL